MGKKITATEPLGWDDPLPEQPTNRWRCWRDTPRLKECVCATMPPPKRVQTEIHAVSDASQRAIRAAVYLRLFNVRSEIAISPVFGQTRVAPINPVSIPRLELCGAVLAVQAAEKVVKELDMTVAEVVFYTDSKVVLGYIRNESRRFYV